jgi:hypothetical protein
MEHQFCSITNNNDDFPNLIKFMQSKYNSLNAYAVNIPSGWSSGKKKYWVKNCSVFLGRQKN